MTIYTFVLYMFFVFVLGKNTYAFDVKTVKDSIKKIDDGNLTISESKLSTLPREASGGASGNGINAYRFLSASFKEKLYAFQRKNSVEGKNTNMLIWTTTDSGITWSQESKVPCALNSDDGPCDVVSSMIFDDELVVIYGNEKNYVISKSADGITWATGDETKLDSSMEDKKLLYYSGKPFDVSDEKDGKKKHIICYETDEEPPKDAEPKYITVAACSESDDEKSWKVRSFLRVSEDVFSDLSDLNQIYFLKETAYFIGEVDSKPHVLFACKSRESPAKSDQMLCEEAKDDSQPDTVPILAVNSTNDSALLVMKSPEAYVMVHMSEDGVLADTLLEIKGAKSKRVRRDLRSTVSRPAEKGEALKKATEVDGSLPIIFQTMFVNMSHFSVMYEYQDKIYNISAEIKEKKRGCLFIKEAQKKAAKDESTNAYTKTITYKDLESETEKECPLDNFEPEGENKYVSFFVKVPAQVDFENSENCFLHALMEEEKGEASKHKRPIIYIKNVVSFDEEPENKMKEYEFVYLASLHNLMKHGRTVNCTSKNFHFRISYTFSIDEEIIKTVAFKTIIKDFDVEENRLSLADYSWNVSDPATAIGSYVIEPKNYIRRFQVYVDLLNNTPNAKADYDDFKISFLYEMDQQISEPKDETTKDYAGIDLTNSSKHYEEAESDIKEDKTIPVKVVVPKEGKVVGLLCPLENSKSLDELHCFDVVKDLKDNTIKFEELFTAVPFDMIPKIMIYNQKVMAVESLLHLNEDSYNALEKLPEAIHFHCVCKVNTHTVTLAFAIGTESSDFGDIDIKPNPDNGSSARSILSSAVVLLVLFNVFSCTGFLN